MFYTRFAALGMFVFAGANLALADAIHLTDGYFNGAPYNAITNNSDEPEWGGRATVAELNFPLVNLPGGGTAGGAVLYAEQGFGAVGDNTLYLMYDYYGGGNTTSFFDVFFEVIPDGHSYDVRIPFSGSLLAFEKPIGVVSGIAADGSLDVFDQAVWTPLTAQDLALARFHGAVTIGASPNGANPHPIAEFDLSINTVTCPAGGGIQTTASAGGGCRSNGIYSPDPAFWGASETGGGTPDPPISSGIFDLNLGNGLTNINPVVDPDTGAPLQQGTALPEPGTWALLITGIAFVLAGKARTRRA